MLQTPASFPLPDYLAVSMGSVSHFTGVVRFGTNPTTGTSFESIWNESRIYNWAVAASIMNVTSTNANDTGAGTGARTVRIYGLDTNYLEISELITLNGQTIVNTVNSYLRIDRAIVETAGSGGTNAGDIYIFTGTATAGVPNTVTQIYAHMLAGLPATRLGVYTVPANKTAYLTTVYLNAASNQNVTGIVFVRPFGGVFYPTFTGELNNDTFIFEAKVPIAIAAKTDIDFRAMVASGTARVNAGFTLLLVA